MLMERVLLEEIAPNDRIMFGMKHLLVKYSLCHLVWKGKKVSEVEAFQNVSSLLTKSEAETYGWR